MSPPNKRCRRRRPADRSPTGLPAYAGVRLGAGVLTLLPVRLSLWLARIAGRLAYHLDGRHHAIATENLRHAYGDSLTPEERERIILGAFLNLTQSVVEFHHATRLARKGRRTPGAGGMKEGTIGHPTRGASVRFREAPRMIRSLASGVKESP